MALEATSTNGAGLVLPPPPPPVAPPPPADPRPQAVTDSLQIQAATPTANSGQGRTFEARANFDTGTSALSPGGHPEMDKTLDAVIATFKTMSPDKQKALLADPDFQIAIEGHASNLGSDKSYDNLSLSRRRAQNTGQYVKDYLKRGGLEIPDSAIKVSGNGSPGKGKTADDNDPADRVARLKIKMPGLSPLPTPSPVVPVTQPETPQAPSPAEAALAEFNKTTEPLNAALAKGAADSTTLVEREAILNKTRAALEAAEKQVPQLTSVAQPGGRALINGLRDQTNRLGERATRERNALSQLQDQLKAENADLEKAAAAKDKRPLKDLAIKLLDKYRNTEGLGKDLPSDAREALAKQAAGLKHSVYEAVARNSDDSKLDLEDNNYMFGRPGPKFKKNWDALKEILAATGPASPEQRSKAVNALKDMGDAVRDFDNPLVKEATQAIFDDLTRTVSAKIAA